MVFVAAKDVIRGLLKTDPDERLTIREVMQSGWVSVCLHVSPILPQRLLVALTLVLSVVVVLLRTVDEFVNTVLAFRLQSVIIVVQLSEFGLSSCL